MAFNNSKATDCTDGSCSLSACSWRESTAVFINCKKISLLALPIGNGYFPTILGPVAGYSSSTSMITSRMVNSSCVACEEVVTLFRTTVPASISSASWRNAITVLLSFSPKACFSARSAHSAAFIDFLPPLVICNAPLRLKNGEFCVPCFESDVNFPLQVPGQYLFQNSRKTGLQTGNKTCSAWVKLNLIFSTP